MYIYICISWQRKVGLYLHLFLYPEEHPAMVSALVQPFLSILFLVHF